jgi:Leucine-rich repeat (LRR) protein
MKIYSLYKRLVAAYTRENLHLITTKIIALHRNKQHHSLNQLMRLVSGETDTGMQNPDKTFYKLMMMYHPDRIAYYHAEFEKHHSRNDIEQLQKHAHIFSALEMEKSLVLLTKPADDHESTEEYRWEEPGSGFDYRDENDVDGDFSERNNTVPFATDFYSVFKRTIYGHENIELPFYYLEELEELDLSGFGIELLDGIQHCVRVAVLDLSRNRIPDIAELSHLILLREAYLSENRIGYIDALGFAEHLHIADLSYNRIDDISALFDLKELEYVNLLGNRVPKKQTERLRRSGIVVID